MFDFLSQLFHNSFLKLISGLIFSLLLARVLRSISAFVFKRMDVFHTRDERTVQSLLDSVIKYMVTFAFIIYMLWVFEVTFGNILTGAGIVGVIISLSARNLIKDLLAGLLFIYENQFNKGDWVTINQTFDGCVETIGFRSLQIRQWSGKLLTINNGHIETIENFNKGHMRVIEQLTIRFSVHPQTVCTILEQACDRLNSELSSCLKADETGYPVEPFAVYGITALADQETGYQYTVTGLCKDTAYFTAAKETRRVLAETLYEHNLLIEDDKQ